jgi:hypothetical protein
MSASHQRPDLQMEVFVLDGGPDQSSLDPTLRRPDVLQSLA